MILKLFLEIVLFVIRFILGFVSSLTPEFDVGNHLNTNLPLFLNMCNQAKNFCYFIIGDAFYVVVDLLVGFITFKLVVFPIILLIRRNLTKTE